MANNTNNTISFTTSRRNVERAAKALGYRTVVRSVKVTEAPVWRDGERVGEVTGVFPVIETEGVPPFLRYTAVRTDGTLEPVRPSARVGSRETTTIAVANRNRR